MFGCVAVAANGCLCSSWGSAGTQLCNTSLRHHQHQPLSLPQPPRCRPIALALHLHRRSPPLAACGAGDQRLFWDHVSWSPQRGRPGGHAAAGWCGRGRLRARCVFIPGRAAACKSQVSIRGSSGAEHGIGTLWLARQGAAWQDVQSDLCWQLLDVVLGCSGMGVRGVLVC